MNPALHESYLSCMNLLLSYMSLVLSCILHDPCLAWNLAYLV